MANRENLVLEALSELEEQRAVNTRELQRRQREVSEKSPELERLQAERAQLFGSSMRRAFADPKGAMNVSEQLRGEIERLNRAIRTELKRAGYPEDYLQPIYRCPVCRDTGYVGEPIHEQCGCLKKAIMRRLYHHEGLSNLEQENFAAFREEVFPDVPVEGHKSTQRGYAVKLRDRLEKYADAFSREEKQGILLCGKSGLGKSFMMHCVAERVLERGFSVIVLSAYRLAETMRSYQFDGEGSDTVADILGCDLLCIDDLGSEPMLRNVTISNLYFLINERRNAGKPIIVTTNCTSEELYGKYDDRIAARLTDPSRMAVLELFGQDVRKTLKSR